MILSNTRVYKYGIFPLEKFPEDSIQQFLKQSILWNELVSIHKSHLKAYEKLLCGFSDEYKLLREQIDKKDAEIKAALQEKGTQKSAPQIEEANAELDRLYKAKRELFEKINPLRKEIQKSENFKTEAKNLWDQFTKRRNAAARVNQSGLDTNTAGFVLQKFKIARKEVMKGKSRSRLQYHKFDGTGLFFYRFRLLDRHTDGVTWPELFERIDGRDNRPFVLSASQTSINKGEKGQRFKRYNLRAKISGGRRNADKTFLDFDLLVHRPIPEGAQIQNAQIIRNRIGKRFRYAVCFTVRLPDRPKKSPATNGGLKSGIDFNWRQINGTVEVATIIYSDGRPCQKVRLPEETIKADAHAEKLQSVLDKAATELGEKIRGDLRTMKLPEGHRSARLWRLAAGLKKNRDRMPSSYTLSFEIAFKFAERALLFEPEICSDYVKNHLRSWRNAFGRRYREYHDLKHKNLECRNYFYRNVAAELVKNCDGIALEEINFAALAKYRDQDDTLPPTARFNRFLAAPGLLRAAIINCAERESVEICKVPAYFTSRKCSKCGSINKNLGGESEWQCPKCGANHNRDENAAKNILKKAFG